ncbi:hypothetical protein FRC07_014926 [Ceratobasidium sp. 392]|nr:hypothetical protein FRC07_014926 [Ceratobasidium sp. 392]
MTDDELVLAKGDEPLFLTSLPGGTSLVPDQPLFAYRMAENIKAAATAAGFPDLLSRKIGPHLASLVLGHKDASLVLTEHYSLGAGNIDLLGVQLGETTDQFAPGYKSQLELHRCTGTAVCMVSKAIASAGQNMVDSDNKAKDAGENQPNEKALENVRKSDEELVEAAQEKAVLEDKEVQNLDQQLEQAWDAWVLAFVPGSPLYVEYKARAPKKVQTNIKSIQGWNIFQKAVKDPKFKAETDKQENSLRAAFKAIAARKKEVRRSAGRVARREIAANQRETHNDTIEDKDCALEYVEQLSSLVTKAVESLSKPTVMDALTGTDSIKALNQRNDTLYAEEAIESYKEVLSHMPRNFTNGAGSTIEQYLDDAQAEIEVDALEKPIPEKQPEQNWHNQWDDEESTDVLIIDVKIALIKLVMDPYLFEKECKERINRDGGLIICHECCDANPNVEPHTYLEFSKLKTHLWQQHTEWNKLSSKMVSGNKFKCPGVCRASKRFESEEQVCDHCLLDDCKDKLAFELLKARHDNAQKRQYEVQNKYKTQDRQEHRREAQRRWLEYFASLDEDDLLRLADKHQIPREEIHPGKSHADKVFDEAHVHQLTVAELIESASIKQQTGELSDDQVTNSITAINTEKGFDSLHKTYQGLTMGPSSKRDSSWWLKEIAQKAHILGFATQWNEYNGDGGKTKKTHVLQQLFLGSKDVKLSPTTKKSKEFKTFKSEVCKHVKGANRLLATFKLSLEFIGDKLKGNNCLSQTESHRRALLWAALGALCGDLTLLKAKLRKVLVGATNAEVVVEEEDDKEEV